MFKLILKTQREWDEHRKAGHANLSPECSECKRGASVTRGHERTFTRQDGELGVGIAGPDNCWLIAPDTFCAEFRPLWD